MAAKEIVTLQIGNYSNFIGTHWWNLQESSFIYDPTHLAAFPKEVNHDVLFREGKTLTGQVTYTPRLVLFDLNHGLGSLKKEGTLYATGAEESVKWTGDVTLHEAPREKRNLFLEDLEEGQREPDDGEEHKAMDMDDISSDQKKENETESENIPVKQEDPVFGRPLYNLDNEVNVWSDYLRTALHPKTIHILKEYQHGNPEKTFDVFGLGQQVMADRTSWDEVEDRVRYFTEECDQLQGFQIFLDCFDGFGGLGSSILSYLADEYSSRARFTFGVTPNNMPDKTAQERSSRIINTALSLHYGCEHSSLYLPLACASSLWKTVGDPICMPYLDYKSDLNYHTSAILAASVDTMTLPYRRESQSSRISDITSSFSSWGRKVAFLNSSLPYALKVGESFPASLISLGRADPWTSLTPHVVSKSSPYFQACVVRGIADSMVKSSSQTERVSSLLSGCTSVEDVLRLYLAETYPSSMNAGCVMRDGVLVGSPFPHIFSSNVNHKGFISDTQRSPISGVHSIPAMTSLQSSSDIHQYVGSLHQCVSKFKISRHNHFLAAGLEEDEYTEMVEELHNLSQCYMEGEG